MVKREQEEAVVEEESWEKMVLEEDEKGRGEDKGLRRGRGLYSAR